MTAADPERKPRGRRRIIPAFLATKEQRSIVTALVATGIEQKAISVYLGFSESTLKRHFKKELKTGSDYIHSALAGTLVKQALAGKTTCILFLLRTRFRWRETSSHELLGADGEPISFDSLDTGSLRALLEALRTATADSTDSGAGPIEGLQIDDEE